MDQIRARAYLLRKGGRLKVVRVPLSESEWDSVAGIVDARINGSGHCLVRVDGGKEHRERRNKRTVGEVAKAIAHRLAEDGSGEKKTHNV